MASAFFSGLLRKQWSCQNKNVLITGASSGIGAALSKYYAARGAHLWLVARRKENLEMVSEDCVNLGAANVTLVVADVATEVGWDTINKSISQPLDLLCLNAGLSMGSHFGELSKKREAVPIVKRLMDVNYMGSVGVYDACLPHLLKSKDGVRVIIVSSFLGLVATPMRTGYSGSKFALKGFFDALRCELTVEGLNPTITLAYPGAVRTEINKSRLSGSGKGTGISLDNALSAEECASIMAEGHARGHRDVAYSLDGTFMGSIKSQAIIILSFWLPKFADRLIVGSMNDLMKNYDNENKSK